MAVSSKTTGHYLLSCCLLAFQALAWGINDPILNSLSRFFREKHVLDSLGRDLDNIVERSRVSMKYSIFSGRSALRDLPKEDQHLLFPEKLFQNGTSYCPSAAHRACAVLLLLRGRADAAHELVLGVTRLNVDRAEYAATHPGQTNWMEEHPLTDSADLIHAALHRMEGCEIGEGGHTGFENAKYWLAGGPKAFGRPASHPVRNSLARFAERCAPFCASSGAIAGEGGAEHTVIAGGGATRTVFVPEGEWDGFAFVDLCQRMALATCSEEEANEISFLQREELVLLLQTELGHCFNVSEQSF